MKPYSREYQKSNIADCSIRKIESKDISKVVNLHIKSFPNFFLSSLGERFLQEFYSNFVVDSMGIGFIAQNSYGEITGIIVGPYDPNNFFSRLIKRRWWAFCLASAEAVLKCPSCTKRLFRALYYRGETTSGHTRALLSSIAVSPKTQNEGIGKQLVNRWLAEIRARGGIGCYLTTDAQDNNEGNRFYQSLGWTIESTYRTPEGRLMNRYVFDF